MPTTLVIALTVGCRLWLEVIIHVTNTPCRLSLFFRHYGAGVWSGRSGGAHGCWTTDDTRSDSCVCSLPKVRIWQFLQQKTTVSFVLRTIHHSRPVDAGVSQVQAWPPRGLDHQRSRERKEPSGSYRSYGKSRDSFRFNALPTEVVAPHRCHLHDCLLVAGPMWCVSLYNPANEVSFFVQASRVISRRKLSTSCCTGSLALSAQKSTPVWFITLLCCGWVKNLQSFVRRIVL